MKHIKISESKSAIVDDDDFEFIIRRKWSISYGYAVSYDASLKKTIRMHRIIMGVPKGLETDHINGNKLDNRKENLRYCTTSENQRNRSIRRDSKSVAKGISFDKRRGNFRAYIGFNRENIYLGTFKTASEAIAARRGAETLYHGEFSRSHT